MLSMRLRSAVVLALAGAAGLQARPPTSDLPLSQYSERILDSLADETGGRVFSAERSERLRETFEQVVAEFRSRYLITYVPRGVESGGWHPIEVKLRKRAGKVTARRGYLR